MKKTTLIIIVVMLIVGGCRSINNSEDDIFSKDNFLGNWKTDYVLRQYQDLIFTNTYYTRCELQITDVTFRITITDSMVRETTGETKYYNTSTYTFLDWTAFKDEVKCTSYVSKNGNANKKKWMIDYKFDETDNSLWLKHIYYSEGAALSDTFDHYLWFNYKKSNK